jgi:hypothetical protein
MKMTKERTRERKGEGRGYRYKELSRSWEARFWDFGS